jgi:hypothetical protein
MDINIMNDQSKKKIPAFAFSGTVKRETEQTKKKKNKKPKKKKKKRGKGNLKMSFLSI